MKVILKVKVSMKGKEPKKKCFMWRKVKVTLKVSMKAKVPKKECFRWRKVKVTFKGMFQVEEGLLERAILHLADSLHPHHFLLSQVILEYQTIGETFKNLPRVKLDIF